MDPTVRLWIKPIFSERHRKERAILGWITAWQRSDISLFPIQRPGRKINRLIMRWSQRIIQLGFRFRIIYRYRRSSFWYRESHHLYFYYLYMSRALTETYRTSSSEETKKLGYEIGESLSRATIKNIELNGPIVIALQGDLGAGKTTFIQGFMKGLGSKKRVVSPTFVLMKRHKLSGVPGIAGSRHKKFSNVFHIDAYRLKKPEQFEVLGMNEILSDPRNVVLIEWPEQAKEFIPKNALWLKFEYGKKENERTITIKR